MTSIEKLTIRGKRGDVRLLLGACLLAGTVFASTASAEERKELLFYDPDGNHQAIVRITALFNSYLRETNVPLNFQAIVSSDNFSRRLSTDTSAFVIVSSPLLSGQGGKRFKPLLVPDAGGEAGVHYRKLLVGKAGAVANDSMATIATAGTKEWAVSLLATASIKVSGTRLISVSKDIDALLALSFGQVQQALVTPSSLEVLRTINAAAAGQFVVLAETAPVLRSPLCLVSGNASPGLIKQLTASLKRMNENPTGRQTLLMLGFSRWVPFTPSMKRGTK